MTGFQHMVWFFWGPLLLLIFGLLIAFVLGVDPRPLMIISWIVTLLVVFGNFAYVVFKDSKARWPGVSWSVRLSRVLTFRRD